MNFSGSGESDSYDAKAFDGVCNDTVSEYNKFVQELIEINNLSGLELLQSITCRNPVVCGLFRRLCLIAFFERKAFVDKFGGAVAAPDVQTADLFRRIWSRKKANDIKVIFERQCPIFAVVFFNLIKTIYITLNSFVWSRLFLDKKKPAKEFIFVDTFLQDSSISESGSLIDRYYPGFSEHLTSEEKSKLRIVPTLFGVRHPHHYIKIFKKISRSEDHLFLRERYLSFGDYVSALFLSVKLPFSLRIFPKFRGYDVDDIVSRLAYADIGSPALFRAICQYKFIEKLKINGEEVGVVVNWFENQASDRALNIAFKKFFPDVRVKGYQGFMPIKCYPSLEPQEFEYTLGTLPDVIYVQNKLVLDQYRQVCPSAIYRLAPAFRFMPLFRKNLQVQSRRAVLFALPGAGLTTDIAGLLRAYTQIAKSLGSDTSVLIKLHPTCSRDHIYQFCPELIDHEFTFTDESVADLLSSVSLVVSSASSVCVEAVAMGCPVAILGNLEGPTMNPIPDAAGVEAGAVFYSGAELLSLVNKALKMTVRQPELSRWFVEVNKANTRELFLDP